jgi:D-alanine-D-alanine ligase
MTPDFSALPLETFQELGAEGIISALIAKFGLPLIVKPARGGSALGLSVIRDGRDLPAAMMQCFAYSDTALIERYVEGTEIALTIIDKPDRSIALPIVQINPRMSRYDYEARYTAGEVEFIIPSSLPSSVQNQVTKAALRIHSQLGLRDLCRVDMIVDEAGTSYFLEATSCPGLTETSIVPAAIAASEWTLGQVLVALVEQSIARFRGA